MSDKRHYSLTIPAGLYAELEKTAYYTGTTVAELLRKFIKLGMIVININSDPNSKLIIREGEVEREIILV